MELREYVLIWRRNWVLIIVMTILGLAAGAGITALMTPEYESRTQLYVSVRSEEETTGDLVQGATYSGQVVNSYVDVVTSGVVLDPVVQQLQLEQSATELAGQVNASTPPNSALINITATSSSAEEAALIANAVGESFKQVVQTQLEPENASGPSPIALTTTQVALEPPTPARPSVNINLLFGLLLGLLLGFGIAVLRTVLDNRVHSLEDVTQVTDKPILGGIVNDPKSSRHGLIAHTKPLSRQAEAYRALRTNLQFVNINSTEKIGVVTSAKPSEGKTTTVLNLALTMSQAGSKVAVVEGDLRAPTFAKYLDIEGGAGLTDVLIGKAELDDVIQHWGQTPFYVLPAGRIPPNPSELLGSARMEEVLDALTESFDYVLIDSPPVLSVTDAAVIGKKTAGVFVVAAAGSTLKQDITNSVQVLETAGAHVFGVVTTKLPVKGPHAYSYGAYGYGELSVHDLVTAASYEDKARLARDKEPGSTYAR